MKNPQTGDGEVSSVLAETKYQFPLGRAFIPLGSQDIPPGVRPFGLRYAVIPRATIDVELRLLSYDPDRQISVICDDGGIVPAMRHTSTKTKTQTGDRSGPDTDEDATGT